MKEKITLNNGIEMPIIGYGVYQIPASITERCVNEALGVGYKLIDSYFSHGLPWLVQEETFLKILF